jgi:uncharacterized integral membrane protein (TIGR00698 family)
MTASAGVSRPTAAPLLPGRAAALLLGVVSTVIGAALPVIGSAVPAVVLGAVVATIRRPGGRLTPGLSFAGQHVLQIAVVVLGLRLSLQQVVAVGAGSLPVMLGTLAVCLLLARTIGRTLRISSDLQALIGCGTGICGASAIAAVAPAIGAASADIAYAVSTIFVFNIAAVLVFPVIGHALGLSQQAFGLFAGTAVNDTSSVVAAASAYGRTAADYAVVVKLVRTLMIIPIVLTLAALTARRRATSVPQHGRDARAGSHHGLGSVARLVPRFLVGFLAMAGVNTLGLVPSGATGPIAASSTFLISIALAGIGLSTDVAALRRTGPRPLLLGAILWAAVTLTSLGLPIITAAFSA